MTMDEKKWRRETDAHTLAEAVAILADKKRMAGATTAAKGMAKEAATKATMMENVSKGKVAIPKPGAKLAARPTAKKGK